MTTRTTLAITLLSILSAGAIAAEATQDFQPSSITTVKTRAEVQANGLSSAFIEASPAPQAGSTLIRAQVMAETREAARLGLLERHEGYGPEPTAAQLEQIRQAGLRAVQNPVVSAQAR